jgi:hypothetical protein
LFGQFQVPGTRQTCDKSAVPWSHRAPSFRATATASASAIDAGRSNSKNAWNRFRDVSSTIDAGTGSRSA